VPKHENFLIVPFLLKYPYSDKDLENSNKKICLNPKFIILLFYGLISAYEYNWHMHMKVNFFSKAKKKNFVQVGSFLDDL